VIAHEHVAAAFLDFERAARFRDFRFAVSHIEDDLRAQYLIGFAPTGKGAVKYRTISLKLTGRARAVRVRAGYLGTEPPLVASRNKHTERKGS
jgi:hypothetical protein